MLLIGTDVKLLFPLIYSNPSPPGESQSCCCTTMLLIFQTFLIYAVLTRSISFKKQFSSLSPAAEWRLFMFQALTKGDIGFIVELLLVVVWLQLSLSLEFLLHAEGFFRVLFLSNQRSLW